MKVEVLISCMHQPDYNIIKRTNIQSDCIVVNQCNENKIDEFSFINKFNRKCDVKFISTTERGLSRSRNMAIQNSRADICLICDDDEVLFDDYEKTITDSYSEETSSDVISFVIEREDKAKKLSQKGKLGIKGILQTSSVQITFRRDRIISNKLLFDVELGSGSGNGAGEENKFLMDCRRAGLKLFHYPKKIGRLIPDTESQWFKGYNPDYFFKHGWSSRRILGSGLSILYILYFVFSKQSFFRGHISIVEAIKSEIKGWKG